MHDKDGRHAVGHLVPERCLESVQEDTSLTGEEMMMSLSQLDARELDIKEKLEKLSPGSTQADGVTLKHHLEGEKKQEWDTLFKELAQVRRRMRQLEKRANPSS
jgi:hypothetical protein